MFRRNNAQQISITDSYLNLPEHVQQLVQKSWAKDFADYIFPAINEQRFAVLYSEEGSRPNTPVNVLVGSMMLKEYFGLTEEELLMEIYCSVLYQYALHLTQEEKPPVSDRSWSRFRERLKAYELETGKDLMKAEMESLGRIISEHMNLKDSVKRMDSLMVASRCKRMSRLEIIYAVCMNAVRLLNRLGVVELLPKGCAHYLDDDDRNEVIYRCRGGEVESRLQVAVNEAVSLKKALEDAEQTETEEYQLLCRAINEQTDTTEEDNQRIPKNNKAISPKSMQNPSDPDATFRVKAGEEYTGYVGNVVETVCEDGLGVVTTMDYEPNCHSDSQFLKDYINQRDENASPETMTTDGAYGGEENVKLAAQKHVELVTTNLTGKEPDPVFADFKLSEDGTQVLKCPMGHVPEKTTFNPKNGMCRGKFNRSCCGQCPNREKCHAKEQRNSFVIYVSSKMVNRARHMNKLSTERYR